MGTICYIGADLSNRVRVGGGGVDNLEIRRGGLGLEKGGMILKEK